jgi:histidine ammonia-lyase
LTPIVCPSDDLVRLGEGRFKIRLSEESIENVKKSRSFLEDIVRENRVVYGVTTGFGKFATTVIDRKDLKV